MNTAEQSSLLRGEPRRWLVTGAAGFIGSNLLEALLAQNQVVVGLDNFSTGFRHNLDQIRANVTSKQWAGLTFIEGDIRELDICAGACAGVDVVLHQAALGSVPRSIQDPILTHGSNITGSLNMLVAARDAGVKRFVYAASSSTYGDHPGLPKVEEIIGRPLSPYAVTKYVAELYADVFQRCYGLDSIGLRYFNVFGRRQHPDGAYAAVIPKWIAQLIRGEPVQIHGDGETSRDFCYVDNVVQANLRAATCTDPSALNQVFNIAAGGRTTLNELFNAIRTGLVSDFPHIAQSQARYGEFRPGDVRHSLADISKAERLLGYRPTHSMTEGLTEAMAWYAKNVIASN